MKKSQNQNQNNKQNPNNNQKPVLSLNYKNGRNLKEIIPPIYQNIRIMNPLYNYENFSIKKPRNYVPPYVPFEVFPEWPSEIDVEVGKKLIDLIFHLKKIKFFHKIKT